MKVAIVHDWLVVNGGAEKVLQRLLAIFPDSDLFTLVDFMDEKERSWLDGKNIYTSFIQRLPFAKKRYSTYLSLFPIAIEQFDLSEYDLVISSSYCVAKGVITGPSQVHISYCHSPARYAWDLQAQYLKESGLESGLKSIIARYVLHKFRIWDVRTSNGVDTFVANSKFIRKRIHKCYRRDAITIYPPVDLDRFKLEEQKQDYYLAASRMVPYKRMDLIVQAFTKLPSKRLKVIGAGPELEKIQKLAAGHSNIEVLGFQSDEFLEKCMQNAKAFVFAAEEDFGILPLEAQACGTPVIAYGKGGCLETVSDGVSGLYFDSQDVKSIVNAVVDFESVKFTPSLVRNNALRFSNEAFDSSILTLVSEMRSTIGQK